MICSNIELQATMAFLTHFKLVNAITQWYNGNIPGELAKDIIKSVAVETKIPSLDMFLENIEEPGHPCYSPSITSSGSFLEYIFDTDNDFFTEHPDYTKLFFASREAKSFILQSVKNK